MRHYLDYAATSAVRPPAVAEAVSSFLMECGATPGRGAHDLALEAGRLALRCRRTIASVMGVRGPPTRLAFTSNATHAVNTAMWGVLGPGDTLVVSAYDHNSVLRPAHRLLVERGVEVRMISGAPDGSLDLDEAARLLEGARLLVVNGASNVLGTLLPVGPLVRLARRSGALSLVDTAQSLGHVAAGDSLAEADMIAFTGHKGLLGPQGIGGLWVREGLEVDPVFRGGGGDSMSRDMPPHMPDRLEVGTVNGPGVAGLAAGIDHLLEEGIDAVHAREVALKSRLRDGLNQIPGIRLLSPEGVDGVGIVTFVAREVDAATLAAELNDDFGVMTRAGLHCAPEVHRLLGTTDTGAVRMSLGWASTEADVDAAVRGVDSIVDRTAVIVP